MFRIVKVVSVIKMSMYNIFNIIIKFNSKSPYIFDKLKFTFDEAIIMCTITVGQLPYLSDTLNQQIIRFSSSLILTYRTSSHYVHNTLAWGGNDPTLQKRLYTSNIQLCTPPHNCVPSSLQLNTQHFTPSFSSAIPLCILELSTLTRVEKVVKNTTII